jgi:3-deoxy-7-phosphoheptulonate synthase
MPTIDQSILPTPDELTALLPVSSKSKQSVLEFRNSCATILRGDDKRIALLLGPCSIHDCKAALDYGKKIKELQALVDSDVFLVMRVFFEKPRTRIGWKGLLYDPFLDGSNHLAEGLKQSRKLLIDLTELGVPCATEFLDPLVASYLSDLISWGLVGARTVASQPHRQLASGLGFPIGFKNGIFGELDPAISGIIASRMPHTHFSINGAGKISALQTTGNPLTHLVLRGSEKTINCDSASVQLALLQLKEHHLEQRVVIDCAHGNSGKDSRRQIIAFNLCLEQIRRGCREIRGLMLESNLKPGKQSIPKEQEQLLYGVSITDDCLGWDETEALVSSICMSGVQK